MTPEHPDLVTRREAIQRVSALLGGAALVGGSALLAACADSIDHSQATDLTAFTRDDIALLDEVAETILPETGTPGAKAAGVGPFIALMVTDAYDTSEQETFRDGMGKLNQECQAMHGENFVAASPDARLSLLEKLDREQMEYTNAHEEDAPAHYFRMMKELTLLGYFTSEIGYTQAMRYVESPGRYDPCVPYAPGDKSWARHA